MKGGFHSVHPLTGLIYYLGVIFLCMILLHPLFLLTSLAVLTVINLIYDKGKQLKGYLPYYAVTGIIVALVNPLFSHRGSHILFYFLDQPVTLEALTYGVIMMLSLLSILVAFLSFNQVITSGKFLFLFSRVFRKITLLTMLAIRFVPLLKRRLEQISAVQRTRGINPLTGSWKKRSHDALLLLQILVTWSLEEALQTADSMKARGYGRKAERSTYVPYKMKLQDFLLISLISICILVLLIGRLNGYGLLQIFPDLESWRLQDMEWLYYAWFVLFLGIPIGIEGREWWKWRSFK